VVLRVAASALKHNFTIEDISHAYDMALFEGYADQEAEPPKILTIGPDSASNLLELIGAEQANGDHLVWHAMRCRRKYLALLTGDGKQVDE
jgi:hypothetical protein